MNFKHPPVRWIRRILLWILFAFAFRFVIIGPLYIDTVTIENWVTAHLVLQTILLYYFFGYYVFPRYLLKLNLLPVLGWLVAWHIGYYIINYLSFQYIQHVNISTKIDRDWRIFEEGGYLGFITSVNASLYSFFYSFPFAIILLGVLAIKQVFDYRTRNLKLERDNLDLELSFLKAQVNPHFLFNTLNSVYGRVFETDELAADLVLRLSELMRYNLYEADVPRISLEKELTYIQNYLDLERNRLLDEDVLIEYEQQGAAASYEIAPLLLIAFVENAFKHGVQSGTEPSYVIVGADIKDGELTFRVENSVPVGRFTEGHVVAKKSGGVGLSNVRRRLENLYAGQYTLTLAPDNDRYTIVLRINL